MKATSGGTVCGRSTSLTKVSGATSRTNSFAFGKSWGNDVLKSPGLSRVVEIQTTTSPERKAPKSEPVGCAAQRPPANSISSQHKPNSLEIDIDVIRHLTRHDIWWNGATIRSEERRVGKE